MHHLNAPRPVAAFPLRVYYEDTDAAGIVYYANYLRFLERGRTEFLRALGYQQQEIADRTGLAFAVRSLSAEYLLPARLDDQLSVETVVESLGRAQLLFTQRVLRGGELLLDARVRIVCLDTNKNKAAPIPRDIHEKLKALL
jgi:acyl-CoA thioester hydrolase